MFQWVDSEGINRYDCDGCGATLEFDNNKGLICPHGCETEYNHPYPELKDDHTDDIILVPIWRTEWKDGQVAATHPIKCECFDCKVLMN